MQSRKNSVALPLGSTRVQQAAAQSGGWKERWAAAATPKVDPLLQRQMREREFVVKNRGWGEAEEAKLREKVRGAAIGGADVAATLISHPVISSALPNALGLAATTYKHFAPTGSIYHSKDSFGNKMMKYASDVGLGAVITNTLGGLSEATTSFNDERLQNLVRRAGPGVPAGRAAAAAVRVPRPTARPGPTTPSVIAPNFREPLASVPPTRRSSLIPTPPDVVYRRAMRAAALSFGRGR